MSVIDSKLYLVSVPVVLTHSNDYKHACNYTASHYAETSNGKAAICLYFSCSLCTTPICCNVFMLLYIIIIAEYGYEYCCVQRNWWQ